MIRCNGTNDDKVWRKHHQCYDHFTADFSSLPIPTSSIPFLQRNVRQNNKRVETIGRAEQVSNLWYVVILISSHIHHYFLTLLLILLPAMMSESMAGIATIRANYKVSCFPSCSRVHLSSWYQ